jgi:hypothetical protein
MPSTPPSPITPTIAEDRASAYILGGTHVAARQGSGSLSRAKAGSRRPSR